MWHNAPAEAPQISVAWMRSDRDAELFEVRPDAQQQAFRNPIVAI
jgi:hypothetical protein